MLQLQQCVRLRHPLVHGGLAAHGFNDQMVALEQTAVLLRKMNAAPK